MADLSPMFSSTQITASRRTFFAVVAVSCGFFASGCTGPPATSASKRTKTDPLEAVLKSHAILRDKYAEAIVFTPTLATRLAPLLKEANEHVAALAAALAKKPPAATSKSSRGGKSSGADPLTVSPPPDGATLMTSLRQLDSAAQQATTMLATTIEKQRAPLVGSIAASHACHVVMLT